MVKQLLDTLEAEPETSKPQSDWHDFLRETYGSLRDTPIQRWEQDDSYNHDRPSKPLDIEKIKQILAQMREGLTEQDLDEIDGAMNVEYIEPAKFLIPRDCSSPFCA